MVKYMFNFYWVVSFFLKESMVEREKEKEKERGEKEREREWEKERDKLLILFS